MLRGSDGLGGGGGSLLGCVLAEGGMGQHWAVCPESPCHTPGLIAPYIFSPLPPAATLGHPSTLNAQHPKATQCIQGMGEDGKGAEGRALCSTDTVHGKDFIPLKSAGMWELLARSCSLTMLPHPPQPSVLLLAQHLTSSLCTSFFLMAFWAAALVAMRSPSAASRSRCCCSSLSGWAAAPWRKQKTHHTFQGLPGSIVFMKQQLCIDLMLSSIPRQPDCWGDAKSLARRAQQQLLCYHPLLEEHHSIAQVLSSVQDLALGTVSPFRGCLSPLQY